MCQPPEDWSWLMVSYMELFTLVIMLCAVVTAVTAVITVVIAIIKLITVKSDALSW
ncbi:MAG: hypothetical protein FWC09_02270 [Lachnospiraceae bacterium]|nr:hypothetical protein [Lachnospiraceae bacterium]